MMEQLNQLNPGLAAVLVVAVTVVVCFFLHGLYKIIQDN